MATHPAPVLLLALAAPLAFIPQRPELQPTTPPPGVEDPWSVSNRHDAFKTTDATQVRIENPWGDIRIKLTDRAEVECFSAIQGLPGDALQPELVARRSGEVLVLRVRFPDPADPARDLAPDAVGKHRLDLGVLTPSHLPLTLHTRSGLVAVKNLRAPLHVETESGDIVVVARAAVTLRTVSGQVLLTCPQREGFEPPQVESASGPIQVELPPGADCTVDVATEGRITSDYSMMVVKAPGKRAKTARMTLGRGGGIARIFSGSGAIAVLEAPG